jgi:serine/threonine protein kinase
MAAVCEKCGHALSPSGLCSRCLLQLGQTQLNPSDSALKGSNAPTAAHRFGARSQRDDIAELAAIRANFPQFEIIELIGRGGMGAVYRAKQKSLDRMVAIKIIHDAVGDPTFAERFTREAKALARLSHPNIVTIHDFGSSDSLYYLVMEFVEGINLRQAIAAKALEAGDALRVVEQVCQALQFAHSRGVVHRDIKPENILLTEDGTVKIADFGLAKLMDDNREEVTLTATRQVMGTLAYMAPEQIDNSSRVDHRADIYSLGVVFYELLTGHLPLGRFEPPSTLGPGIDERVDPVVMKTLSRQPIDRYQAASELQTDVTRIKATPPSAHEYVAQEYVAEADAVQDHWPSSLEPPAKPLNPPSKTFTADHGTWDDDAGVSVPFRVRDVYGGFAEGYGRMTLYDDRLRLEWKVKDAMFGVLETSLREKEMSLSEFNRIQIKDYGVMVRLQLVSRSLGGLDPLPQREPGTTKLAIARSDAAVVREWMNRNASHPAFAAEHDSQYFGGQGAAKHYSAWGWIVPIIVAAVLVPMVFLRKVSSISPEEVREALIGVREIEETPTLSVMGTDGKISYLHIPFADIRLGTESGSDGSQEKQIVIEQNSVRRGREWMVANGVDDKSNIELRIEDGKIHVEGKLQGESDRLIYVIEDYRNGAEAKLRELIKGNGKSVSGTTSTSE